MLTLTGANYPPKRSKRNKMSVLLWRRLQGVDRIRCRYPGRTRVTNDRLCEVVKERKYSHIKTRRE